MAHHQIARAVGRTHAIPEPEETDVVSGDEIRRAQSCATDARQAAREFHDGVAQPDMALVMFFCSAEYDLDVLAAEIDRLFAGTPVIGCTTAGEIGPAGYRDASISGASLPASSFTVAIELIDRLQQFDSARTQRLTQNLVQRLASSAPRTDANRSFALLLVDGLSVREEPLTRVVQEALENTPLVGGSAGDAMRFISTHVYLDGAFHPDAALLALVTTPLPFQEFRIQHFVPTARRVVVTAADVEHRIVTEIDGEPAAAAYARLVGSSIPGLDPMNFAEQPMVVLIDGTNYVRAIKTVNPDGSLTFACSIDDGLVLRAASRVDFIENLSQALDGVRGEIGDPQLTIGFDCALRKLEMTQCGLVERVEAVFRDNNVTGFSSYGEQYHGAHVNQTLTGIAIGRSTPG